MIFITLPLVPLSEEECSTDFERWTYILKNMETMTHIPFKEHDLVFNELEKVANFEALIPRQKRNYLYSLDFYNIAKEQEDRRFAEGRAEGMTEQNIATARRLKDVGMDSEFIFNITGLNPDAY